MQKKYIISDYNSSEDLGNFYKKLEKGCEFRMNLWKGDICTDILRIYMIQTWIWHYNGKNAGIIKHTYHVYKGLN